MLAAHSTITNSNCGMKRKGKRTFNKLSKSTLHYRLSQNPTIMNGCKCMRINVYVFSGPSSSKGIWFKYFSEQFFVTVKCAAKAFLAFAHSTLKRALGVAWWMNTLFDRPRMNKTIRNSTIRGEMKERRTDTLHSHWVHIQFFLTFCSFFFFSANNSEFVILAVCVVFDLSFCHQHPLTIAILNAWFITLFCSVDLFKWS